MHLYPFRARESKSTATTAVILCSALATSQFAPRHYILKLTNDYLFRSEVNFVVCDGCEVTRYCTFKCMGEAKQYHQWECGSNLPEHVGIAWLGLRVALAGEACEASGDESKIDAYQRVCSLLTHISDMTAEDKLQYSLVAFFIYLMEEH